MLSIMLFIYSTTEIIQAQNCSVPTTPNLNAICPPNFVLTSTGCRPFETFGEGPPMKATLCFDRVNPTTGQSDCSSMKKYCTNSIYRQRMMEQCPLTCGYCNGSGNCFDRVNPMTGILIAQAYSRIAGILFT